MKVRRLHIRLRLSTSAHPDHDARRIAEAVGRSLATSDVAPRRLSVELAGLGRSGAVLGSAVGAAVADRLGSQGRR